MCIFDAEKMSVAKQIRGALNDLFGWMFILVAVLPCLQLFQNRTKFFFRNDYFILGLYL